MNERGTFAFGKSAVLALLAASILAGACGSDSDDRPPPAGNAGGRGGSGSGARSGSSQGGSGDASSSGGEGGDLGPGGQTGGEGCGDGVQTGTEECDGDDFDGLGCPDFGLDEGDLVCSSGCLIEIDQCSGVEQCADGRDNDGDGAADCLDDDCQDACADPCSAPGELADPAELTALTIGRSDALGSECSMVPGEAGPDAVYGFTAAQSGTLEIELQATKYMVVSVHMSCGASSTAVACSGDYLSLPVTAGDELTLAVESPTPEDAGEFTLRAFSREIGVCGDGYRDAGESCDDGDELPDDGCDASCEVESLETESNDTFEEANAYYDGFYAEISPAADVDLVAVEIGGTPGSLVVEVRGIGTDCERLRTDSFVEVLGPDGVAVIDSDDDGGDGLCSRLVVSGLAAGTHYVRVSAAASAETPTFPYVLDVTRNWCGDGLLGPGEQCDEGDTTAGDGCSAICQNE